MLLHQVPCDAGDVDLGSEGAKPHPEAAMAGPTAAFRGRFAAGVGIDDASPPIVGGDR